MIATQHLMMTAAKTYATIPELHLRNGSRIAIIGGGPAGAFFAKFALRLADRRGINISITIFDGKDFYREGPLGCNLCAGVICAPLMEDIKKLGINLPEGRVQRRIEGYYFQTRSGGFLLKRPYELLRRRGYKEGEICTVYRGNGPRFSIPHVNVSFDDFLLEHVISKGVNVIREEVEDIILPANPSDPIRLRYSCHRGTSNKSSSREFSADLLVGAFGLNTKLAEKIHSLGFGYEPPRTVRTYQAEINLGSETIENYFGNNVHAFAPEMTNVRFATIIPKADFVTVSLIGYNDVRRSDALEFLNLPFVRRKFPPDWEMSRYFCSCRPKIPVSPAKNPFTDRFVIIGDASSSRYLKNGIGSAFLTARLAAEAAFKSGISSHAFEINYAKKIKHLIDRDNKFGAAIFRINDLILEHRLLAESRMRIAASPRKDSTSNLLRFIYWNMFTGEIPYTKIVLATARNPLLHIILFLSSLEFAISRLTESKRIDTPDTMGPLRDGQSVAIIGGGPAGTSCAIALRNLAQERGINLNVVIYEGKEFKGEKQFNQCAGVLSPPIDKLLEDVLKVPFPRELIQRTVEIYYLYADNDKIELQGNAEPSYALRRILFDDYLLSQAERRGVEIVNSRATDIEFNDKSVMVYSESDNRRVDVVVGAFGLDDGTAMVMERDSAYRQPRFLNSIVTKVHPQPDLSLCEDIMKNFGGVIYAFLPPHKGIEFGAVIPKKNHLTVNVAGADVTSKMMDEFLALPQVRKLLPENFNEIKHNLQYYKGRFPISPAANLYGDRYVMVGDAAGLVRPFKGKGVTAACITGIKAAETMMNIGISEKAFSHYYHACREVTQDLRYGKALRFLAVASKNIGIMDHIIKLAKKDNTLRVALFNCVSAYKPFKTIVSETLSLRFILGIVRMIASLSFKKVATSNIFRGIL